MLLRVDAAPVDPVGHRLDDGGGLAGARTREHPQPAGPVFDDLGLFGGRRAQLAIAAGVGAAGSAPSGAALLRSADHALDAIT